jgi:hypothetical protein
MAKNHLTASILSLVVMSDCAAADGIGTLQNAPLEGADFTRVTIVERYKKGMSPKKISRTLRCGVGTAFHTLKQRGLLAA